MMKRLLFTLLIFAATTATMSAYDFEHNGFYYNIINGNEATVVAGENQYSGDVIIPSTVYYGGTTYSVTSIGSNAFSDCYELTKVVIPASVTLIEANAFGGCYGLSGIYCLGANPPSATDIFGEDSYLMEQIMLYVFDDVIENYYSDEFWCQFPINSLNLSPEVKFSESADELTIFVTGAGYLETYVNGRYATTGEGALTYKVPRQGSDYFHVSVNIIQHYNGYSSASYHGYDSRYDNFTSMPMLYASEAEQGKGLKINIGADSENYYNLYFWTDGFEYLWPEYCDYRINGSGEWTRGGMGDSFYLTEYGDYTIEAYAGAGGDRCGNSGTISVDVHYGADGFYSRCNRYIVYNGLYCEYDNYEHRLMLYLSQDDPYGIMLPTQSDIVIPASFTIAGDEYTVNQVYRNNRTAVNSITCLSATPIDASLGGYEEVDPFFEATLFVPQEGLEAYKAHDQWGQFLRIVPFIGAGPGDANGDGSISVSDVTCIIDMLLSSDDLPAWADVNGDGTVSIIDVTTLIDMLLTGNY